MDHSVTQRVQYERSLCEITFYQKDVIWRVLLENIILTAYWT